MRPNQRTHTSPLELYNFAAVESVAICPLGWHVPTKEEFDILFDGYGGVEVAHLSMMDVETWNLDLDAMDYGYNVLPAGWLYLSFQQIQEAAFMWTSSPYGPNDPRRFEWNIQAENNFVVTYEGASQAAGKSVRCLKDNDNRGDVCPGGEAAAQNDGAAVPPQQACPLRDAEGALFGQRLSLKPWAWRRLFPKRKPPRAGLVGWVANANPRPSAPQTDALTS